MSEPKTTKFTTDKRPDLKLYFPRLGRTVTFVDGAYSTSDRDVIRALRQHPDIAEKHEIQRPAKSANRDAWDAYAVSVGIDPEQHGSKDDLIAAIDTQTANA